MTNATSDCDNEPIHIPGAIQPYGVMIVLSSDGLVVTQASKNAADELGLERIEGASVQELFLPRNISDILTIPIDHSPRFLPLTPRARPDIRHNGLLHLSPDGQVVLELERVQIEEGAIHSEKWLHLGELMQPVNLAENLDAVLGAACKAVRELTGYDRVMIYRFHEDFHGEVVAEEKLDEQESWLGLHYPASDIPTQARELYRQNWIRMIPDVDYEPVGLLPSVSSATGKPLDMTYCHLRSVSPVHVQYLKNMGAKASLSLSLISPDRLWGLIACHNTVPRYVHYLARDLCKRVASRLSQAILSREMHMSALIEGKLVELCRTFAGTGLNVELLKELIPCHRVVVTGELAATGVVESDAKVAELLRGIDAPFFAATALTGQQDPGLLAIRIRQDSWLALLRPEYISVVRWAGDPNKPVLGESHELQPRASFKEWSDSVRGRSKDWSKSEIEISCFLQTVLSGRKSVDWLVDHLAQRRNTIETFAKRL